MLRLVLTLALISAIFGQRIEVIVFRGLIPMMTCQFDTSLSSIQGNIGIRLNDCKHSPEAEEFQDSIENLTYREDASSETVIPFRFVEKFSLKTTHYLGAVIQSNYRCSKTGDEFTVSLVFGYCKNDLNINDFEKISNTLEEARVHQNSKVHETRKVLKQEGGKLVANRDNLDDLNDAHLEASNKKAELEKENAALIEQMNGLEKKLEEEEVEAANLEEAHETCFVQLKTIKGNMCTVTSQIDSLERQISALERRLLYQEETNFGDEYEKSIEELNKSFEAVKVFNKKMTIPFAKKTVTYDHKDLQCLY